MSLLIDNIRIRNVKEGARRFTVEQISPISYKVVDNDYELFKTNRLAITISFARLIDARTAAFILNQEWERFLVGDKR